MLSTALFDYELPAELIAQRPTERRDGSRMMVLNRRTGEWVIRPFTAIGEYLSPGDALIYNDTRVLRGRMFARKNGDPAGAKFELLLVPSPKTAADLQNLVRALLEQRYDGGGLIFRHISSLHLETDSAPAWSLDGEYAPSSPVVDIVNRHQALEVLL